MKQLTYTVILTVPIGVPPKHVQKVMNDMLYKLMQERNHTGVRMIQGEPAPSIRLLHIHDVPSKQR